MSWETKKILNRTNSGQSSKIKERKKLWTCVKELLYRGFKMHRNVFLSFIHNITPIWIKLNVVEHRDTWIAGKKSLLTLFGRKYQRIEIQVNEGVGEMNKRLWYYFHRRKKQVNSTCWNHNIHQGGVDWAWQRQCE